MEDPPLYVAIKVFVVILLVLANGFFVAGEFALITIRRQRLKALADSGNRPAQAALRLAEAPSIVISVTQFGITIASLALGYIGESTFAHLFERLFLSVGFTSIGSSISAHTVALPIAFVLITFLHIVVGETVPKMFALDRSERVSLLAARSIELLHKISKPFIWLLDTSSQLIVKPFGLNSSLDHAMVYTEEEIRHLVSVSHKQGHLIAEEQEMIHNVFDFTDMVVREVMVPRPEIVAVEAGSAMSELTHLLETTRYTRLPVYKEHMDNIVGIIHAKDLLPYLLAKKEVEISKLQRKPLFVPDTAQLVEVLQQMRRAQNQLAIVVDEHGGVEGIVTMEDLLEEIVGEIRDEHDVDEENLFHQEPDGSIVMEGALSIREANRKLNLNLPESDDYTTVAGFLMAKSGKLLSQGETVEHQGVVFQIDKVERRRVSRVRIMASASAAPQ